MYKRVLVGVDFRQGGRDAIALARTLADPDASLTLVHVYPGRFMPSHAVTPGLVADDRARGERELERERAEAAIEAELLLTQGPTPGLALHEAAEERSADLIVLGSCHRGAFGRAMLGDDTRGSLNGAPCAVAVAPAGYAAQPKPLGTIGVAYDGSPESKLALDAARALAEPTRATVRALCIVTLEPYSYSALGPAVLTNISEAVDEAEAAMKSLEGVECHAEYGFPSADLADFAAHVDLLVVGSRGYGPWGRIVHGSTSNRLAHHTRGPLLIVPRAKRAEADREAQASSAEPASVPA